MAGSTLEVVYTLDKGADGLRMEVKADWHEIGGRIIPVLTYRVPVSYHATQYLYDVPAGAIFREEMGNDVPGLQYGLAVNESGKSAILVSDCKYGYRGQDNVLSLTLINSSTSPDPYPERGVHHMTLFLGGTYAKPALAQRMAGRLNHAISYQSGTSHTGVLPMRAGMLELEEGNVVLSSVCNTEDGAIRVRAYETEGRREKVCLRLDRPARSVRLTNALGLDVSNAARVEGNAVVFEAEPYSLVELHMDCR